MKDYTVYSVDLDDGKELFLYAGVAKDCAKAHGLDVQEEVLRLSNFFQIRHGFTAYCASAECDEGTLYTAWFYRSTEAESEIERMIQENKWDINDCFIRIVEAALSVQKYNEAQFPMTICFHKEKTNDRNWKVKGEYTYSKRLNLHPAETGAGSAGKLYFPVRTWRDIDDRPVVLEGVDSETENYGFVRGHFAMHADITKYQVVDYCYSHPEIVSGHPYLVSAVEGVRGVRWYLDCGTGYRGMYYFDKDTDSNVVARHLWEEHSTYYEGVRSKEQLDGTIRDSLTLEDAVSWYLGFRGYGDLQGNLNLSDCNWSICLEESQLDVRYNGHKINGTWAPTKDAVLGNNVLMDAMYNGVLTAWRSTASKTTLLTISRSDVLRTFKMDDKELSDIIKNVQSYNAEGKESLSQALRKGVLRFAMLSK